MKEQEKQKFMTRDLYLATTLITLKFFMEGCDFQIEGGKNNYIGWWKFEDSALLQETISKYQQGMLLVEPKIFITNMHSLKASIQNTLNSPGLAI